MTTIASGGSQSMTGGCRIAADRQEPSSHNHECRSSQNGQPQHLERPDQNKNRASRSIQQQQRDRLVRSSRSRTEENRRQVDENQPMCGGRCLAGVVNVLLEAAALDKTSETDTDVSPLIRVDVYTPEPTVAEVMLVPTAPPQPRPQIDSIIQKLQAMHISLMIQCQIYKERARSQQMSPQPFKTDIPGNNNLVRTLSPMEQIDTTYELHKHLHDMTMEWTKPLKDAGVNSSATSSKPTNIEKSTPQSEASLDQASTSSSVKQPMHCLRFTAEEYNLIYYGNPPGIPKMECSFLLQCFHDHNMRSMEIRRLGRIAPPYISISQTVCQHVRSDVLRRCQLGQESEETAEIVRQCLERLENKKSILC